MKTNKIYIAKSYYFIKQNTVNVFLMLVMVIFLWPNSIASAQLSGCAADVSSNQITANTTAPITIALQNTDIFNTQWFQINTPSSDFTIVNSSSPKGWSISSTSTSINFSGSNLTPGSTQYITLNIAAGNSPTFGAQWAIAASDDPSGAGAVSCYGSQNTDIVPAPIVPPTISNIKLSNLSINSITLSWQTDVPSKDQINYGTSTSYGKQTDQDQNLSSSHRTTLSGLSANTAYHFQILADAGNSNTASSSDNEFLTPYQNASNSSGGTDIFSSGNTSSSSNISDNHKLISALVPIITDKNDKTPPLVNISPPSSVLYKSSPTLSGVATDKVGIAAVQYSTDKGLNWLPVDTLAGLGTQQVNYSFTPKNLDDGTYQFEVRAINVGGIKSDTPPLKIVIDRLPPSIGANVFSYGNLPLNPDSNGILSVPINTNFKVSIGSAGGPIHITLEAYNASSNKLKPLQFDLLHYSQSQLWSGVLSFPRSGVYKLVAKTIDGAGTQTVRQINTVKVEPAGIVSLKNSTNNSSSLLTVYTLNPDTKQWVKWDGASYGQNVPLKLGAHSSYSLLLPAGTYYLRASASGYQSVISQSFTLSSSRIISENFVLNKKIGLGLSGSHIYFPEIPRIQNLLNLDKNLNKIDAHNTLPSSALGKSVPAFTLKQTDNSVVNTANILGRPTVISIISTWAPEASDQLSILNSINVPNLNVIAISEGESLAKLTVYSKISDYKIPIVADPDQELVRPLNINSIPTTYFINRHGVVKKVMVGVLSSQEILQNVQY